MEREILHSGEIRHRPDGAQRSQPQQERRRAERRPWRRTLRITVIQPGGDQRRVEIVTRNISSTGMAFLHNGFLHNGTLCRMQLITVENAWVDVTAVVVRCRLVAGRVHEVGVRLNQPIDDGEFVSEKLHARALLIADSAVMLRLIGQTLTRAGAEVLVGDTGRRALELIANEPVDLVLVDVEMLAMRTPALARALRKRGVTAPIVALTANDDPAVRTECLAGGCTEVLPKSISRAHLLNALLQCVSTQGPVYSSHAGNPGMAEAIQALIRALPEHLRAMERCLLARDVLALKKLALQLKAAAATEGGCGFEALSTEAGWMVRILSTDVDWQLLQEAFNSLQRLAGRVRQPLET